MSKMKGSESNFLAQDDIERPTNLTIKRCALEVCKFPNGSEEKYVLHFADHHNLKPLILNAGNRKAIIAAYGDEMDFYAGKQVQVYVNPDVEFNNERVGGLRVRVPDELKRQSPLSNGHAPTNLFRDLATAVVVAAPAGITRENIIAAIMAKGGQGWKPERDTPMVQDMIRAAQSSAEQGFDDAPPPDAPANLSEIPFSMAWLAALLLPFLMLGA